MRTTRGLSWLNVALGWGAEVWLGPLERLPLGLKGKQGLKERLLAGVASTHATGGEGLGFVADSIGCAGVKSFGSRFWWNVTSLRK